MVYFGSAPESFVIPSSVLSTDGRVAPGRYSLLQPTSTRRISLVLKKYHDDIDRIISFFPSVERLDVYTNYSCIDSVSKYVIQFKTLNLEAVATLTTFFDWNDQVEFLGESQKLSITLMDYDYCQMYQEFTPFHYPSLHADIISIGNSLEAIDLGKHSVDPPTLTNIVRQSTNIKSIVAMLDFGQSTSHSGIDGETNIERPDRQLEYEALCMAIMTSPRLKKLTLRSQKDYYTQDIVLPHDFNKFQSMFVMALDNASLSYLHLYQLPLVDSRFFSRMLEQGNKSSIRTLLLENSIDGSINWNQFADLLSSTQTLHTLAIVDPWTIKDVIVSALSNGNSIDHLYFSPNVSDSIPNKGEYPALQRIKYSFFL
ncbi:hypothetical protein SAMD00019534_069470 [Acytostelium subglobosum LB1]|uniref:hypothetical protein n=1 Tax=Acytostelium subglobosum LB1 TaxID=1410327 RepID=UPI0006450351|nr:hypothetical protein SAMD00019534_069470 [Acytostelium subglobosum LB1]GAM23772.1 hypothetical protein SAMD00019534_069470 [Acytostelium subglobosum LB1]|eukprot:XP_012753513.1 hypothetical protein SAMD00019534_069470 [Acytostelium subglobosum LB1]